MHALYLFAFTLAELLSYIICNSYYMVICALAYLLLKSQGHKVPEVECNKEPMHR